MEVTDDMGLLVFFYYAFDSCLRSSGLGYLAIWLFGY